MALLASSALIAGVIAGTVDVPDAVAASSSTVQVPGTGSPAAASTPVVAAVPASDEVDLEVSLASSNPAAAAAFAQAVSTPGSSSYRHYLTPTAWEARFSPTTSEVSQAEQFLTSSGFQVTGASPDRMVVDATGTASQVSQVFATSLAYHRVKGHDLRLASSNLSVPRSLQGVITGITGVNQTAATPDTAADGPDTASAATTPPMSDGPSSAAIAQPPGYRVPGPPQCSSSFGSSTDTTDPAYGQGYPADPGYVVCGYTPGQLRSAYSAPANGGTGQTIAIVDAYASPTLLSDAQTYDAANDPSHVLNTKKFSEMLSPTFNKAAACDAPGWYGEQTLDVESAHAMAPAANILYVGAKNCDNALYDSLRSVIDSHAADVITDSWGDDAGDLLDDSATKTLVDNLALMAAGTGVSLLFSSGDDGDEFATTGYQAADFPPSDPNVTAVGGTSLAIGADGTREAEYGWSTGKSVLCAGAAVGTVAGCTSANVGTYLPVSLDGGSGGGTSVTFTQPAYQAGVVPNSLATRNSAVTGTTKMRVEPDISTVADPGTGFLVGETQTFPNGVYYDTYRIGGTSLASPVFAGLVADANAKAGTDAGFLNPELYSFSGTKAINDILATPKLLQARTDYANSVSPAGGYLTSMRIVTYTGTEEYCDGTGNCATRPVALATGPGYDSMTGLGSPGANFVTKLANASS